MDIIHIKTQTRNELVDITEKIESLVRKTGLDSGACLLFCPHTTAALAVNENADPSVKKDIVEYLQRLVPYGQDFSHLEGNSDAHIKNTLLQVSLTLPVDKGSLALGRWKGVYFCEFDGPRNRQLYCKIIKD